MGLNWLGLSAGGLITGILRYECAMIAKILLVHVMYLVGIHCVECRRLGPSVVEIFD